MFWSDALVVFWLLTAPLHLSSKNVYIHVYVEYSCLWLVCTRVLPQVSLPSYPQILSPILLRRLKSDVEFRIPLRSWCLFVSMFSSSQPSSATVLSLRWCCQAGSCNSAPEQQFLGSRSTGGEELGVRKTKRLRNKAQRWGGISNTVIDDHGRLLLTWYS